MSAEMSNPQAPTSASTGNEPYYIYLTNSVLDTKLQTYIRAYVDHIAGVLEPRTDASQPDTKVVTFIPERNGIIVVGIVNCSLDVGILLFGMRPETVRVIYRLLKKLDEETVNLRFEVRFSAAHALVAHASPGKPCSGRITQNDQRIRILNTPSPTPKRVHPPPLATAVYWLQ